MSECAKATLDSMYSTIVIYGLSDKKVLTSALKEAKVSWRAINNLAVAVKYNDDCSGTITPRPATPGLISEGILCNLKSPYIIYKVLQTFKIYNITRAATKPGMITFTIAFADGHITVVEIRKYNSYQYLKKVKGVTPGQYLAEAILSAVKFRQPPTAD